MFLQTMRPSHAISILGFLSRLCKRLLVMNDEGRSSRPECPTCTVTDWLCLRGLCIKSI